MNVDVVIHGGKVIDGTGAPARLADVGIVANRVVWVADEGSRVDAGIRIDAVGRYVVPGFVDTHSHVDGTWYLPETHEALLSQGVTSVIVGQDGLGYAPARGAAVQASARYFGILNGLPENSSESGTSIGQYLNRISGNSPVNVAALVPLGLVWLDIIGDDPSNLSSKNLAWMKSIVAEGVADGAVGVSSGLEYFPNCFAEVPALSFLSAPAASFGLPHVSHIRGYGPNISSAMSEMEHVALASGVPLHVSHYRGPARDLLRIADGAIARGVDLTFDSYPYTRGCTILQMLVLPTNLNLAGRMELLSDADSRAALAQAITQEKGIPWLGELRVSRAVGNRWEWAEGLTIDIVAEMHGKGMAETVLDLLRDCALDVSVVTPAPTDSGEEDYRELMKRAEHMAGSDGIYLGRSPHPRGWGTFARFLGYHVRDLNDWSWVEAVDHLSTRACRRFKLAGRGTIVPGSIADLVVLDPAKIAAESTYISPKRPASGVGDVLVAGVPALRDGKLTGYKPGVGLRAGVA